eukprot:CAMPEP_0181317334 /NCGR_PEP_ID=MMETSP1101-20121128/16413_1 /TAXON_ID=46948 /ORGANISM="Rhodomonas abbreviata, Strain Caron Lab Isolate" /LENGTH=354 /DNA_ID=CAMNT_0023424721 /DNA_START=228 /DNA_END=1289 /DNA_ORIENTATION=-
MQFRLNVAFNITVFLATYLASVSSADLQHTLDLDDVPSCYTLLHNTGSVGCRSVKQEGSTAPLIAINSRAELNQFTASPGERRSILLNASLFDTDALSKLQDSGRCDGVLLADSPTPPPHFSPAPKFAYCECGQKTGCSAWNPFGNDLANHGFNFPIVLLNESTTELLQKQAKGSMDILSFPHHVVEMRYHMDVFNGYEQDGNGWWEVQAHARCCPKCTPDCGSSCCDKARGFRCMSGAEKGNGSWTKPTCVKEGGPNSLSCIDYGTCLPLGGYSVWGLGVDSFPPKEGQKIIVAAAAMDATSIFHDIAQGAAADGSSVVALIAAMDALRGVRTAMQALGAAIVMPAILQAEAW